MEAPPNRVTGARRVEGPGLPHDPRRPPSHQKFRPPAIQARREHLERRQAAAATAPAVIPRQGPPAPERVPMPGPPTQMSRLHPGRTEAERASLQREFFKSEFYSTGKRLSRNPFRDFMVQRKQQQQIDAEQQKVQDAERQKLLEQRQHEINIKQAGDKGEMERLVYKTDAERDAAARTRTHEDVTREDSQEHAMSLAEKTAQITADAKSIEFTRDMLKLDDAQEASLKLELATMPGAKLPTNRDNPKFTPLVEAWMALIDLTLQPVPTGIASGETQRSIARVRTLIRELQREYDAYQPVAQRGVARPAPRGGPGSGPPNDPWNMEGP